MKFSLRTPEQKAVQKQQKFENYAANQYRGERTPFFARMLHPKMHYAAKMLDAREAPTKAIMEHADDLIFHISTEGIVLSLSDSYLRALGYGKKDLLGRNAFWILHPDDVKTAKEALATACETGQGVKAELRIIAKDGSVITVESKGSVINDADGRVIGGIVINRDITERKRAEEEIATLVSELEKTVEELKETVRGKDMMMAIVAHDLRNPIGTMTSVLELLKEDWKSIDDAGRLSFVQGAYKKAKVAQDLLLDLLNWHALISGGIEAKPAAANIKETVGEVAILMDFDEKGITFENRAGSKMGAYVDQHMLDMIMRNLITNAIKFTNKGGRVAIGAESCEGGLVKITVEDTGVGMSGQKAKEIFVENKSGRKLSEDGTEGEKGTGLGLLMVREMVTLNNGTIEVESKLGKGTVFTITLPASAPESGSG